MSTVLQESPLVGLESQFPNEILVGNVHGLHLCWFDGELSGLACFVSTIGVNRFAQSMKSVAAPEVVTFDEARALAQNKPNIMCLFLFDDDLNLIDQHFVR